MRVFHLHSLPTPHRRGPVVRACVASRWKTTIASVDRYGLGDEQCPLCAEHIHCEHLGRREVRIPVHPALPAVTEAVSS